MLAALASAFVLVSCHRAADEPRATAADEPQELNAAAAMLDAANDTNASETDEQP